jgi:hypothetical protein
MRSLLQAAAFIALATASGLAVSANPDPALHSFADLYRLTVTGAALPAAAPAEAATQSDAALRPVSTEPPARYAFTVASPTPLAGGYAFSIGAMPEPGRWLFVLSGLAAAAWVARRRLYSV